MRNYLCLAAVLFGILLLVAVPVSAENISGTLDRTFSLTVSETFNANGNCAGVTPHALVVNDIQNAVGLNKIMVYDLYVGRTTFSGTTPGTSTPFIAHKDSISGVVAFNGTIGYQRIWDKLGAEQLGYQYIIIDNADYFLGKSGAYTFYLDYSNSALNNLAYNGNSWVGATTPGLVYVPACNGPVPSKFEEYRSFNFHNTYNATKPSTLGISGKVTKIVDGLENPSRVTIYDGTLGTIVASESVSSSKNFIFDVPAQSIVIGVLNGKPEYINTSVLFAPAALSYNISVSPTSGKMTDGYTGTLDRTTGITAIRWYAIYPRQNTPSDFYDATSTASSQKNLNYALIGGNWMGWDTAGTGGFTNNKGGTLPNPVSLIPRYSGQILVGCYVYLTDGTFQSPTTMITVGDNQALQKITFHAEDALSGSHVSPTSFNIKKLSTNTWVNQSEVRPGQIDVQYPTGSILYIEAVPPTGSGYSLGTLTYQVLDTTGYTQNKVVQLWKGSSSNVSMTTANLIVNKNSDFSPIKGASIVLSDGQNCVTSAAGSCQFSLLNGTTTYYATVRATGYQTNQFYFLPVGASYSKAFQMVAIGATQTPYITVPPGGVVTTPAGVVTLNPASRAQSVSNAGDIWFNGAVGLSSLIFLAVVWTIVEKFRRKRK